MPSRLRFAKRSSTRAAGLIGVAAIGAILALLGVGLDVGGLAFAGVVVAIAGAAGFALHLIVTERRRHEVLEEELSAESSFLEGLVESMRTIAATLEPEEVLERTQREAEDLFGAKATLLSPGETPAEDAQAFPLRIRDETIGALQLVRSRPLDREEQAHAALLADFASRTVENARLLAEARVRETERARLSDQLITAEQDERRRLALFLHDGPVQSLAGISLMLDAVIASVQEKRFEEAEGVLRSALDRHRDTIRSLRDLSFNIEPVVLRDQGFGPAVRTFAEQVGIANEIQVDLDIDAADGLAENARVGLYQIIREAVNLAIRRGPPARISIRVADAGDGGVEAVIADDGTGERRRATFDAIEERARTLSGSLDVEAGHDGGTAVHVVLPSYTARR
jgi:signal transduction histidine kinase